jgi:hypothetical protein
LYADEIKAREALASLGKGCEIEHRPGENVRCENYCNVSEVVRAISKTERKNKMSELSKLEHALLCAARAFAACYSAPEERNNGKVAAQPKARVTETSNGIPVCEKHGKAQRPSKSGKGYYCVDCFIEKRSPEKCRLLKLK